MSGSVSAAVESAIQEANQTPTVVLDLLGGTSESSARSAGIFTKEDMINILGYVKKGKSLPDDLDALKAYLKIDNTGVDGLEPADILKLFKAVHDHAIDWEKVQDAVRSQSEDLDHAAKRIVDTGDDIISCIDSMTTLQKAKTTLQEIGKAEDSQDVQEELSKITFTDGDGDISTGILDILDMMKEDVEGYQVKTEEVKIIISDYRMRLVGGGLSDGTEVTGLEPELRKKKNLIAASGITEEITELETDIQTKETRLNELKEDYTEYCVKSGLAAPGGLLGMIAVGIFGKKATDTRGQIDTATNELKTLRERLSQKNKIKTVFGNLNDECSDIGIRMLDAEIAINHLDAMWKSTLAQISLSVESFQKVDNAMKLMRFSRTFKNAIDPWRDVGRNTQSIMRSIDDALREFKEKNA